MTNSTSNPHAVLLSSPGLGHLIPVLELGNRLVTHFNVNVTIFVIASQTSSAESDIINSAVHGDPKLCDVIELPRPDISHLVGPDSAMGQQISVVMREIRPAIRTAISALDSPPSILIVDLFGTESLVIGEELGIPKYVFIASNAKFLALTVYTPTLDKLVQGQFVEQKEPFEVPGCMPVRPKDVVEPMMNRNDGQYREYVRTGEEIPLSDGVLVNTWEELQPRDLKALRDDKLLGQFMKVPVYSVGPIVRPDKPIKPVGLKDKELFDWLDTQPSESVLYVSFGSGGTLSHEQMAELAWGLELSQQRFIWVVRSPTSRSTDDVLLTVGVNGNDNRDPSYYLSKEFFSRTRNVGVVIEEWTHHQRQILTHPSIGGFLTHCGWNSTLESIVSGVPMIACPLYAEQRLNATLLTEELGVAVGSKIWPPNGVIGREEIEMMVRKIMVDEEGIKIRNKVKKFKESADNRSSYGGLLFFAEKFLIKK